MKIRLILLAAAALPLLTISTNAALLTLANANFQDSGNDSNPASWTTAEAGSGGPAGTAIYVYASGGSPSPVSNVLAMYGAGGHIQQSFSTAEATGGSFGSYTIGFDYGYRNNTATSSYAFVFSLINVTDGTTLGTQNFTLPPLAAAFDSYRALGTGSVTIQYDSTDASFTGDTVALRISSLPTGTTDFNNTAWVDNLSVNAVIPEPAAALLGAVSLLGLLRRRR